MSKRTNDTLATGAKRVVASVSLAAMLFAGMPMVAYASVPAENVVGDLQTTEDRTEIKKQDGINLDGKFNTGCVLLSDVEKAICLSNLLNGYYFDGITDTNTNVNEILNLNVSGMYDGYTWNAAYGDVNAFCANNLANRPACDAFITLSSKSVANEIRNAIGSRVRDMYIYAGRVVEGEPRVVINGSELYVLVTVDGRLKKVVLSGETVQQIIDTINGLDGMYSTAMRNITGKDTANDGSFMYNGKDCYTGESVYLSMGDDNKKATIQAGINMAREIKSLDQYQVAVTADYSEALTKDEKTALSNMGYNRATVRGARKEFMSLVRLVVLTLTK